MTIKNRYVQILTLTYGVALCTPPSVVIDGQNDWTRDPVMNFIR